MAPALFAAAAANHAERVAPQFAAYLSTPAHARGYPPMEGDESLVVEASPVV